MILKISLFLHVIAAIFWIGGMLFLTLVVAPFLKTLELEKKREIYQVVGTKYRFWGWIALVILVVTGPVNLYYLGVTPDMLFDASFYTTPYGRRVLEKIGLVVVVLVSSVLHDFWFGPGARSSQSYSRIAMILGRANLLIALAIVVLAVMMRTGG